ncbi:MAG: signal peptidase I [Marmoricola sp.]
MTEPSSEPVQDAPASAAAPSKTRKAEKKPLPVWQESILLLAIALVLAVGIKYFFVQAFYIPSPSMEPLFIKNDRILVQKVSYWGGGDPKRGDIVVFKDPGGWLDSSESRTASNPVTKGLEAIGLYPSGGHLVKRVIGIGGDRVKCCDAQGRVTVNGKALNEKSYLPKGTLPSEDPFDVRIPAGHLWVMGDNRGDSYDSRGHIGDPGGGFVADDLVVGKVWALIWPWKRAGRVHTPATFHGIPDNP